MLGERTHPGQGRRSQAMGDYRRRFLLPRRWLDDLRVAAVGVRKGVRRIAGSVGLIGLAVIVVGAVWILGGTFDRLLTDTIQQATPQTDNSVDAIGAAIGECWPARPWPVSH